MKLQIASLNVRGIGNNVKRREVFNWLRTKNFLFICCKKFIVPKIQQILGLENGVTKRCLAAARAAKQGSASALTTILI